MYPWTNRNLPISDVRKIKHKNASAVSQRNGGGFNFGIESGVVAVSVVGWPATGEAWVLADGVEQGGVN